MLSRNAFNGIVFFPSPHKLASNVHYSVKNSIRNRADGEALAAMAPRLSPSTIANGQLGDRKLVR